MAFLKNQNTFKSVPPLEAVTRIVLLFILIVKTFTLNAQNTPLSNKRIFTLKIPTDTLINDSLTIIPSSIQIIDLQKNTYIDSSFFTVKNNLILRNQSTIPNPQPPTLNTPIQITYRVLPFNLGKKYKSIDSAQISPLAPPLVLENESGENAPIFDKGMEYNGNYTQGLSVGNAQNLVVNQNFNLNLAGCLGDLDILAAMTDNNLPIQAEGNTQQLREIDKIFIQIKRKNNTLIAGDYELQRPQNTYFTSYYKKQKGITYSNSSDLLLKKSLTTTQSAVLNSKMGIGIARGKFSRNILPTQEGNQGPYRLLGNEGSNYFIILSGTEKVYFDGKLLLRGDENDYIIDYNRGDIQFTPKRLVTKDSRIIVEFEYADQTYLRSTAFISNEFKINKLRLNFNFYSEQDSKNATGTQALDSLDRSVLRMSGNDFDLNPPLSIRQADDGFRSDRIQYKLVDTLANGVLFKGVLVFSNNSDSALYTASFTPVGEGKGNYIQVATAANGRVYQWIAPDTQGKKQGNFEPIKKLTPPNKQQLMSLGADYQLFKNTKFFTEVALSHNDRNRFSSIGDSANTGLAVFSSLENHFDFGKKQAWTVESALKLELTQKHFKPLNPYRSAEFTRDWNIPVVSPLSNFNQNTATIGNLAQTPSQTQEQFVTATSQISRKDWFSMIYELGHYTRMGQYKGLKNTTRLNFQRNGWTILGDLNTLNTATERSAASSGNGVLEKTNFSRPRFDFNKTFNNKLKLGFYSERERNKRADAQTDTLTRASFYYDLWRFYGEKIDSAGRNFGFNFTQRFDYQPIINRFLQVSKVDELNVNGNFTKNEHSQLTWNLTYRNLKIADTAKTTLKPQVSYLGRVEYNFNAFKNAIYGNTLYEIGSGQEQRLEYQYVRVNKGEGQYVWRNRNADTIPQLDEFEIAPFQDQADYVRVTLFTNQFIRTNNVAFSQSLRLDPRAIWGEKQGFLKFLSRFSTNSSVQISRRNAPQTLKSEAMVIAEIIAMRNSLFFNRSSPVWDIEIGQLENKNRGVFITGFEERGRTEWFLRNRWNISKSFSLLNYCSKGTQFSTIEAFKNRNYALDLLKIEPELTWMLGSDFRLAFAYKFKNGINTLKNDGEKLKNKDISAEATWNQTTNAQFRAKFSYVKVAFTGERNTPIEFALLEGLQNGRNFLWNVSLDRVLSKSMFLTVNYEGRKTGLVRVVHVGRVAVRANF